MSDERRIEREVELSATPEQVWEAVATGRGISTWFVPHEVDDDGTMRADFGSGHTDSGRVLAWEEGRRVVFGGSGTNPDEAMEFLVEGRHGGSTVLRFVHSGFGGEDWEAEYHGKGWDLFLHNLAQYFRYFADLPVTNVVVMGFTKESHATVWQRLYRALGIDEEPALAEPIRLSPQGAEPIAGVVDVLDHGMFGVRGERGLYRFGGAGADAWGMVNLTHYLYGVDADRHELTASWQSWLDGLFPE